MDVDTLKHKLRELKKLEGIIRFGGGTPPQGTAFVWSSFFSTKAETDSKVKYSLDQLLQMERERVHEVYDEYFYHVYYRKYQEDGLLFQEAYDPGILAVFGLPPTAGREEVKKKFRELAKKYHPDLGGSSEKMIELLEAYKKLQSSE